MKRLERYRLIEPLCAGTTGRVWSAETPEGEVVVLKVGHERSLAGALAYEALLAALVHSPHMPALRGLGLVKLDEVACAACPDDRGVPALALAPASGTTVATSRGTLDIARRVARGVGAALADLHELGLAHGDVKPANIVADDRAAMLIDWGSVSGATNTSVRGATPRYLGRNDRSLGDARERDLLALGIVLAELIDPKVRRASEPLEAARRIPQKNVLSEIAAALLAPLPGARPSIRWVLRKLESADAPHTSDSEDADARKRLVRAAYLKLRRFELGASEVSPAAARWLHDAVAVAAAARAMCEGAEASVPALLETRPSTRLEPLDAERRLRWLVSMVGPSASSWGDALVGHDEANLIAAFERLATVHAPHAWTLPSLLAALRGEKLATSEDPRGAPLSYTLVGELARATTQVPPDATALSTIERFADELPESLVLHAADGLRLSGELGRALRLATGRAAGTPLLAEILRRLGDREGARTAATQALATGQADGGRAKAVLGRLALDADELAETERFVATPCTAQEFEVAALLAHKRGNPTQAEHLARQGSALAQTEEHRARLAATRAYVTHPNSPVAARDLFGAAANHAARAGAVLEEATYRTGEAAACVDLGELDKAEAAAQRAILLFEDVLSQPQLAARAWLSRAAAWTSVDATAEALAAAQEALRRTAHDLRARSYSRLAACDALPVGDPRARELVLAEVASFRTPIDDDGLHARARVLQHAPELLEDAAAIDSRAASCGAHAQLEWWRARAERCLLAPTFDAPAAHTTVTALAALVDAAAPIAAHGKAMLAGRRLARALEDPVLTSRFEAARLRLAERLSAGSPEAISRTLDVCAWLGDRSITELAPTTQVQALELQHLVRALGEREDLDSLLGRVLDLMLLWTSAERGLLLVPSKTGELRPRASRHLSRRELAADQILVSQSLASRALQQGAPVVAVDAMNELSDAHASVHALELRSVLVVPLFARGEVVGVVYLDDRFRKGAFGPKELAWATTVAPIAAIAIADARKQAALTRALKRTERAMAVAERTLARRESALAVAQAELASRRPRSRAKHRYPEIIGESDAIQRLLKLVDRVADSDVPVLIHGESGTGKELVARAIHRHGSRASRPFVSENCAALPETLLESALFGHVPGAFTGATRLHVGLLEAAHGGTLFLDEIGEMSLAMQTKLLRVLEDGVVRPLGSERTRRVDVRVLAATHRDLGALVESGDFREDLLYRLDVIRLELPALRDRADDIPLLVKHFLEKHAPGRSVVLSTDARSALNRHPWPGNIRQLENELRRALLLCDERIEFPHLSISGNAAPRNGEHPLTLRARIDALEADLVTDALARTRGNQTKAAALLGLSRFGLHKLIKRLGLRVASH